MSKTLDGAITFLMIVTVAAILQGYIDIYRETLVFVRNNIVNVDSEGQELIAKNITLVIHLLSLGSLVCTYWSYLRFERNISNPYLPLLIGGCPMLFTLFVWIKLTA